MTASAYAFLMLLTPFVTIGIFLFLRRAFDKSMSDTYSDREYYLAMARFHAGEAERRQAMQADMRDMHAAMVAALLDLELGRIEKPEDKK